jgi:cell division protein FtsB
MAAWKFRRESQFPRSSLGMRIIFAFSAALTVYCLLSALAGPAGVFAYRQLQERRAAMAENLAKLSLINAGLRSQLDSLKSDADRAALEARALGYIRPGETEIVLPGRKPGPAPLGVGTIVPMLPPVGLSDSAIKAAAALVGLALFALGLPIRRRAAYGRGRQRNSRVHSESRT